MKRRFFGGLAVVVSVSIAGNAQVPGARLHREIPGDLGFGDLPPGAVAAPPASREALQAAAGRHAWSEGQRPDEDLLRPQDPWSANARAMDGETRSPPGTELEYHEVFNPSVAPFKRVHAYDAVDELGRLVVRDPSLRPMALDEPAPWAHEPASRFTGDVFVELSSASPTPLPSVAAEQRVVAYRTSPEVSVAFFRDSAGNLFARADLRETRRVRLTYVLEAPEHAFVPARVPQVRLDALALPPGEDSPMVPDSLVRSAPTVLRRLNLHANDTFRDALDRLTGHFRAFRDAELAARPGADLYTSLALGGVGACRHRAYAFVLTLHALGVPARYVGNEAHAWAEVYVPSSGWARIDLGGWNVPLHAQSPSDRDAFLPSNPDPFPRPPEYQNGYSTATAPLRSDREHPDRDPAAQPQGPNGDPTQGATGPSHPAATTRVNGPGPAVAGGPTRFDPNAPPGDGEPTARAPQASPSASSDPSPSRAPDAARGALRLRLTQVQPPDAVRGAMVQVRGEAHDADDGPVEDLPITISLSRRGRDARAATPLGTTVSRADGTFEAQVQLPVDLNSGDYELLVRSPGDARHQSARGE